MLVSGQQQLQQLLNLFSENVPGFFFQLYRKPEGSFQLQLVPESAGKALGIALPQLGQDSAAALARVHPNDAAIASTVIALSSALGLGVIAEGVETAAQRDALAALGCYHYQGFYFSRPLPGQDFVAMQQQAQLH